jgi:hypothetical protein
MKAVEDMAIPDALAFARPNKATLNSGGDQEFGKGSNLSFSLWEVAAD